MTKPGVVFVSYFYPPACAVGGLRISGFAHSLGTLGRYQPIVVTVGDELGVFRDSGVTVLRTKDRRLRGDDSPHPGVVPSSLAPCFERIKHFAKDEILFPDEQVAWLLDRWRILEILRELKEYDIQAVVASSPPATDLLLGRWLADQLRCAFIPDYRDAWSANPFVHRSKRRRGIDRFVEKRTLRRADTIIVACEMLKDSLHGLTSVPCTEVITGVDIYDAGELVSTECFEIVYAGQLYGGLRDLRPLFRGLLILFSREPQARRRIRVRIFGPDGALALAMAEEIGVPEIVECCGVVSPTVARSAMVSAALLVSVSWDDPRDSGALPGKLYEYLGARRPILCLGPENRRLRRLLEDTTSGRLLASDDQVAEMVESLFETWAIGRPASIPAARLQKVTKMASAEDIEGLIEGCRGHHE